MQVAEGIEQLKHGLYFYPCDFVLTANTDTVVKVFNKSHIHLLTMFSSLLSTSHLHVHSMI